MPYLMQLSDLVIGTCCFVFCNFCKLEMSEQALGEIPLGFGIDKPFMLSAGKLDTMYVT